MTSCGLKNSLCRDETPTEPEDPMYRFSFVDGQTGLWTVGPDYGTVTCPLGGLIVFNYVRGNHDIVQLSNRADWDACQTENATVVSPPSQNNQFSHVTHYYNCSEPNTTVYLTCSVSDHCELSQKVAIHTSATESAYDETTGNWTSHVDSLERVQRLLGLRFDDNDLPVMDRGYQTEELAEVTTELIWCALDHCPHFAHDVDPEATLEDCESMVFTLLGFVTRKRPVPQWNVSQEYYQQAIERGGTNFCTAQSYLTQLYLTKGDMENATQAIDTLCGKCREEPALIQQAEREYLNLDISVDSLDFDSICNAAKSGGFGRFGNAPSFSCIILLLMLLRRGNPF